MQNLNSANKEFKSILKKRGMLSNKMGDEISESWLRCISTGLDTFKDPKQSLISSIELKQIKDTLDLFLKSQKEKIEKRLMVLSSISHDIGTPATKLKLRTALIDDKDLKEKLETDIDRIIEMMNGVLSYTRSEIDLEEETEISYISLIELSLN